MTATLSTYSAAGKLHSGGTADESFIGVNGWTVASVGFSFHWGIWHLVSTDSHGSGQIRVTINVTSVSGSPELYLNISSDDVPAATPSLTDWGPTTVITTTGIKVISQFVSTNIAFSTDGYIDISCNAAEAEPLTYEITKIEWIEDGTPIEIWTPGTPPVADFSGVPTSGAAPLTVGFTDLSTNTPTSWSWAFGDTNTSTDQNPIHVYAAPGVYTVALTATNGDGSDTETKTDYITVFGAPVADFSGTPTSGAVSLSVGFTDASTNTPTSWYWFFGDGGTATTQNQTHIYTVVGVYTVALTATNAYGSGSKTRYLYITVTDIAEVGPAEIENCDIDTGGLATGLRVADVAIARDNNLGSLVIDASAELRAKDNAYGTLTNNGTLTSLAGDRSAWDTTAFPARHARDISEATGLYHLVSATTQTYTVSNPSTDRAYDVSALTLNELAAVVGTLISDLIAKGLLS